MVVACAAEQFRRLLEQLPREIVDAIVTAVLEGIEGDALPGTREAADEHELHFDTLAEWRKPCKAWHLLRAAASIFLHFRLLPPHEFGRRVNAAKLQNVVAHGGLEQHREVATCCDRNHHFPDDH